jgi:hypothetical protein
LKKFLLLILLSFTGLFFTGCMETTEELTIAADGSGTYNVGMDMSGFFDLMDMMKGMDTTANVETKSLQQLDTVVAMRDFTDTASHLSAEEKALMKEAKMKMKMNEADNEFKMEMNFPFTKLGDVQKLMQLSQKSSGGNVMQNMLGNPLGAESGNDQMPSISNFYEMVINGNVVERKLNKEKYNELQQNEQLKGAQMAGDMLESIKFNTVIRLPRPAKKVSGTRVQLSADKKTLTLKGNMQDLFQDPEAFTYRIEY